MNRLLSTFACLSLCGSAVSAVPLQEFISQNVELVWSVRNFAEMRAQWLEHPLAGLFEEESLIGLFEAINTGDEPKDRDSDAPSGFTEVMEQTFGLNYDDLFELFPGQASLAFYNLSAPLRDREERQEIVLMAEFSADAARLNELMDIQFKRNAEAQRALNPLVEHQMIEESFMGETLYFDETFNGERTYIEDGYALVDGILILAAPESRLRAAVESIKQGAASAALAQNDVYRRSQEDAGRGDVAVYLNLSTLMPHLNEALMQMPLMNGLASFGVTAQSLETALSVESLQAMYLNLDLIPEGLLGHYGLIYREKRGLLSLLSYTTGRLPEAYYVPSGVLSSSVSLLDCSAILANLEQLLTLASPNLAPLMDIWMQTMQTHTGIDLRASILENLGGRMVSLAMLDQTSLSSEEYAQPQQLFVISVKDAGALTQALETLKDGLPALSALIEEQTYAGETIYTIKGGAGSTMAGAQRVDFSYVVTRSNVIVSIGHIGLLHEVLSRIHQGDAGFWQDPQIERLFERIEQPNPVGRSFVDVEQMIEPLFQSLLQTARLSGSSVEIDASLIASEGTLAYDLISEMNQAADGLFGRTLLIKRKDGE